jgi:hypothetical protein
MLDYQTKGKEGDTEDEGERRKKGKGKEGCRVRHNRE